MFWKDGLFKKFVFVISGKMVFLFSRKYDIFSLGGKWKEMIFIKSAWNMVFSAYMRRRHRHDISPPMHLRVTSPASPKKMIFILKDMVFLLKYLIDWHPTKGPRSSHRKCYTRKGVLRNFAKFKGKSLCQSQFFNKAKDLRPATLLGLQLY